jgi:hypothetical protein
MMPMIAEHDDARRVRPVLTLDEDAALTRLDPQDGKQLGRHRGVVDPLRIVDSGEIALADHERGQRLERPAPLPVLVELGLRKLDLGKVELDELIPDGHRPIRVRIGQGLEKHCLDDAENRHRGADPDRHRDDRGDDRRGGPTEERPHAKAQI